LDLPQVLKMEKKFTINKTKAKLTHHIKLNQINLIFDRSINIKIHKIQTLKINRRQHKKRIAKVMSIK
jgi:hypothetical protein